MSVPIVRSRSCSCTTLASVGFVNNRLQEVIVKLVRGRQACGKQRRQVKKGFLTQVRCLGSCNRRAVGRQHPYRNLETLPNWIDNRDRTVAPFGTTNDLQNSAAKRMKRIVNLDVRIFCAQGIVSADGCIHTCIASYRRADSRAITKAGSIRSMHFSYPSRCSALCFERSLPKDCAGHIGEQSYASARPRTACALQSDLTLSSIRFSTKTGLFMRSQHLAAQRRCFVTLAATRIAWPSAITGYCPSTVTR